VISGSDHLAVQTLGAVEEFAQRPPTDGGKVGVQEITDLPQKGSDATRLVEVLHQEAARGPQVEQDRHAARQAIEILERERNTRASGEREEMHDGVGGTAESHEGGDGVFEGAATDELMNALVSPDHFHDAPPAGGGQPGMSGMNRGNSGRAGQSESHGFGEGRHG
jgi:hypothetical protein